MDVFGMKRRLAQQYGQEHGDQSDGSAEDREKKSKIFFSLRFKRDAALWRDAAAGWTEIWMAKSFPV